MENWKTLSQNSVSPKTPPNKSFNWFFVPHLSFLLSMLRSFLGYTFYMFWSQSTQQQQKILSRYLKIIIKYWQYYFLYIKNNLHLSLHAHTTTTCVHFVPMNNGFYTCSKNNSRYARFVVQLCEVATERRAPDKRIIQINISLVSPQKTYILTLCALNRSTEARRIKILILKHVFWR